MLTQETHLNARPNLGASITFAASKQTYFTVLLLVDHGRAAEAYKAYAYFRWVDDTLDRPGIDRSERLGFIRREQALLAHAYGEHGLPAPHSLCEEEMLLLELVRDGNGHANGLEKYIRHLMAVMVFDAERRGRMISHQELVDYERNLATAVTEALHHYIGQKSESPQNDLRYLAATGAHIAHMLRDTVDDNAAGYFNIPLEFLETHHISPTDISTPAYREFVKQRVDLARQYFAAGRQYLAQVKCLRCRLAGYSYIARFTPLLDTIESDGYLLRPRYN